MGGGKTPQAGWMIATSGRGQDSPLDKLETWNSEGRRGIAPNRDARSCPLPAPGRAGDIRTRQERKAEAQCRGNKY